MGPNLLRHFVTFSGAEVTFGADGTTIWARLADGSTNGVVWGDFWANPIRVKWNTWRIVGDTADHKCPIQSHLDE